MSDLTKMLDWALRYIKMGWPVLPLRGKIPRVPNGSKDATLNESQARKWWAEWPDANIGVATGLRFFVLDVDVKGGGEDSFDFLFHQHGAFPETLQQVTGTGGKHLLFQMPAFPVRNSAGAIAPGIDIRGAGGYIVVSPSVHPETGREYFWDGLKEIEEQAIAAAPPWLLEKLQGVKETPKGKTAPGRLAEGGRNTGLFKLACSLRRKGLSAAEILATLKASNDLRCVPPLPLDELQTIANSSERYAPDAKGNLFPGAAEEKPPAELPINPADVEAAVDEAIGRNDLAGAMRLVAEIAKIRPQFRVAIIAKLKQHFKRDFPAKEFAQAIKDAGGEIPTAPGGGSVIQFPPAGNGGGGSSSVPPEQYLVPFPFTDAGNGERIVLLYGADIRYCTEMRKWLVWDGQRWKVDELGAMRQKAKQMARQLYAQALNSGNPAAVEKHARASESYAAITAALGSAASEKGISISAEELDQQPYLLNCINGVIDLRTGRLLPHDREYLITKLCHVTYEPDPAKAATCPTFLRFLHWAMGHNEDADMTEETVRMIAFLQRAFGYALTGDVSEKCVFVFHGHKGDNGKTTLLETFRFLLREYAALLSIDTLMTAKGTDATQRADLADLRGARFVMTSEVEQEHKLSEGKLKYITAGMGRIKSCRKYENPLEFEATHKLYMDCNYRPKVRGADNAIWNRLKCIPFNVSIAKEDRDKTLPDKLRAEAAGILAWAVRGAAAWCQAASLGEPPEVSEAGADWREHDDPIRDFLQDCCQDEAGAWETVTEIAAAYRWWCKENSERYPLNREHFNERMAAKGYQQKRSRRDGANKQLRTWEGLIVKPEVRTEVNSQGKRTAFLTD